MKFVIRDDDLNFFFDPIDIEKNFRDIWDICPISMSVIPFVKGDWKKQIAHFEGISPGVINEDVLKIFLNYCTDDTYKQQVKNLVSDSNHIKTGKSLTNFDITSYNNDNSKINTIVENKNTLIYFWTTEYMSTDYLVKRVKYLEKQYPYIEFIGINMQNNFGNITTDPNLKQLERKNQFKLTKNSDAYNFLTSNYPRAIIIDKNGIVKNGFTSLNSKNIHQELLKLEK